MVITPTPLENLHSKISRSGGRGASHSRCNLQNDNCGENVSDNDDNCIVSLPCEKDSNEKNNIEPSSEEDEYSYSNKRPNSNKRPRV